jgi:hypothetical protein
MSKLEIIVQNQANRSAVDLQYYKREAVEKPTQYGKSMLGTPVYSYLRLTGADGASVEMDSVLMSVGIQKQITKTAIAGKRGTVKELINEGDYAISVSGKLVAEKGVYPDFDTSLLIGLLKEGNSLEIESPFLEQFGITTIVIENAGMPQAQGRMNEQPFSFQAYDDEPIELILSENA